MGSTTERGSSHVAAFFETRYPKTASALSTDNEFVRQYFYDERRWVMEALPNMPEDEWQMYMEWVKGVGEALPRKGTWKKLKAP